MYCKLVLKELAYYYLVFLWSKIFYYSESILKLITHEMKVFNLKLIKINAFFILHTLYKCCISALLTSWRYKMLLTLQMT